MARGNFPYKLAEPRPAPHNHTNPSTKKKPSTKFSSISRVVGHFPIGALPLKTQNFHLFLARINPHDLELPRAF